MDIDIGYLYNNAHLNTLAAGTVRVNLIEQRPYIYVCGYI